MNEEVALKRDEIFGKSMAVLDVISARVFERDKARVEHRYFHKMHHKPMSYLYKAHEDVMSYAAHFGEKEIDLMDELTHHMSRFEIEEFNDDPIGPKSLIFFSKEAVRLKEKYKTK